MYYVFRCCPVCLLGLYLPVDDVKGVISQYDDSLNAATTVVAMQRVSMELPTV